MAIRRLQHLIGVISGAALAAILCCNAAWGQDTAQTSKEQSLVELANRARSDAGVKPLTWDPALAAAAKAHAERMASEGPISHRYGGEPDLPQRAASAGAHFSLIEENIAIGNSAGQIHDGWMKSQGHHDNMLNPKIDRIGVALVSAHGVLFAVADYAQGVSQASGSDVEANVGKVLTAKGLRLKSDGTAAARQYCSAQEGDGTKGIYARFLMRWQSADITKLPPELEKRIASGVFHEAAVGACPPQGDGGSGGPVFSGYRVAVLLY
jgi:cysteine-rich secretory family protein